LIRKYGYFGKNLYYYFIFLDKKWDITVLFKNLNYLLIDQNKRWFFLSVYFKRRFFMSFFTRQRWVLLLAALIAIAAPGVTYAQLDLKGKAVETLTNGVMKELDKKFTEMIAKEALSAAVKANIVKNLSEMSRPIEKISLTAPRLASCLT
jgi:hypothetical protein